MSTIVAIVVPVTQMVNAKKERLAKYESDKKQHISRKRLDMEFEIYKELSEKVVSLGVGSLTLFDKDFDFSRIGKRSEDDKDYKLQNKIAIRLNDANVAIYKYAMFIPAKCYEKFEQMKSLCREQLNAFEDHVLFGNLKIKILKKLRMNVKRGMLILVKSSMNWL